MRHIPERDWKKIRAMKQEMLNIYCERIFEAIDTISEERKGREHETYLKVWKLLEGEDRKIVIMFDDLKRSNAIQKLASWMNYGVISNEDMIGFSDETQQRIRELNEIFHE